MQVVTSRLAMFVQAYTLYSSVRPFGVSTILGAVDKEGPQLYVIEPSGIAYVRSYSTYSKIPLLTDDGRDTTVQL